MPSEKFRKLRVFVACPGDVEDEKKRLGKVIESLKFDAESHGFFFELVEWRQAVPDLGVAQEIIFNQLNPESWDIFIGILWTRFGTPSGILDRETHRELTGTEAEILKVIEIRKTHGRPPLEEVKRTQEWQQDQLRVMQMVLPLLLPKKERQHLINLKLGKNLDYQGSKLLRFELRRLRSMGLLKNHSSHNIADIRDNLKVKLSHYVCLTENGKEWVEIIRQSEEMARDQPKAASKERLR